MQLFSPPFYTKFYLQSSACDRLSQLMLQFCKFSSLSTDFSRYFFVYLASSWRLRGGNLWWNVFRDRPGVSNQDCTEWIRRRCACRRCPSFWPLAPCTWRWRLKLRREIYEIIWQSCVALRPIFSNSRKLPTRGTAHETLTKVSCLRQPVTGRVLSLSCAVFSPVTL